MQSALFLFFDLSFLAQVSILLSIAQVFSNSCLNLVFDLFAGSNTTGFVAETLGRNWIASELSEEYLEGSLFRFDSFDVERIAPEKNHKGRRDVVTTYP